MSKDKPDHADEMEQVEQEAADLLELQTGYREPDASGEPHNYLRSHDMDSDRCAVCGWNQGYILHGPAPADGAGLTDEELNALANSLGVVLLDRKVEEFFTKAIDAATRQAVAVALEAVGDLETTGNRLLAIANDLSYSEDQMNEIKEWEAALARYRELRAGEDGG